MQDDVEIVAGATGILADQSGIVCLVDRRLEAHRLVIELATDIDESRSGPHRITANETAFYQLVRIVPDDLPVLARARFRLVGVDHEIMRFVLHLFRHEGPFHAGRETRAAASAQPGILHIFDDVFRAAGKDLFRGAPVAALAGAFKAPVEPAVEVCEDAVLVPQHHLSPVLASAASAAAGWAS